MLRALATTAAALGALLGSARARAGGFDAEGNYVVAADAAAFVGFESDDFDPVADRFVPADVEAECLEPSFHVKQAADALEGGRVLAVDVNLFDGCAERLLVSVPAVQASYRASVWMRHGSLDAQMTVVYPERSGREIVAAKLAPTGRTTSDGWVELASNDFPVDGAAAAAVYLRVFDYDSVGTEIDALELVPSGAYWQDSACAGVADPVCGAGAVCIYGRCRLGRLYVPPLPSDAVRHAMVDRMQSQLRVFFGGRKTRLKDLPAAIGLLEAIRWVSEPWAFWNGWAAAIRRLHDWHTRAHGPIGGIPRRGRLNLCFIEGDADASVAAWPKHPVHRDVLVSHAGKSGGTYGIGQGDRLVEVDGKHPLVWALALAPVDWEWWQADDDTVYAEVLERLRGLVLAYAKSFSVVHCDARSGACAGPPEIYDVAALRADGGQVGCDNRPFYHIVDPKPPSHHHVGWDFYRGRIEGTTEEEAIFGLVWDTLYGGGDPNGYVNGKLNEAIADFKANARGVLLDHRAGSGGTLDGAVTLTRLVSPERTVLVFASPTPWGTWDGPSSTAEATKLYEVLLPGWAKMEIGAPDHDPTLPVALLLHRDGSASDFMPFAMKGSPKVRLFASQPTAGAFSTYFQMSYWAGIGWQVASGDSISATGETLIGNGVAPDELVVQKQSDLLGGKDSIHEAALAWVRQELKP
jgi:hypothetical protein